MASHSDQRQRRQQRRGMAPDPRRIQLTDIFMPQSYFTTKMTQPSEPPRDPPIEIQYATLDPPAEYPPWFYNPIAPTTPTPVAPRKRSATVGAPSSGQPTTEDEPEPQNGTSPKPPVSGGRKEPTLLADFFLGRPSPQRLAAQRARRRDAEIVQEQVRKEMKESAVRKVPPPNGVTSRVNMWQKRNSEALFAVGGDPDIAPSEPSEIAIHIEEGSVTEEDRIRIKLSQHKREPSRPRNSKGAAAKEEEKENNTEETEEPARRPQTTPKKPKATPKKRIVSDDHWMKKKRKSKSPPRMTGARRPAQASSNTPSPIPKDFLKRTAKNPTPSQKIKNWAVNVEPPESKPRRKSYHKRSFTRVSEWEDEDEDELSTVRSAGYETGGEAVDDASSRRTERTSRTADNTSARYSTRIDDDGIRVRPIKNSSRISDSDGIRVTTSASLAPTEDDGIRVTPTESDQKSATSSRKLDDDGIRVRPIRGRRGAGDDDGIRIRPVRENSRAPRSSTSTPTAPRSSTSTPSGAREPTARREPSRRRGRSPSEKINSQATEEEVTQITAESQAAEARVNKNPSRQTEERRRLSRPEKQQPKHESPKMELPNHSDISLNVPPSEVPSLPSTLLPENLDSIPFGQSAFSELDLPASGPPRHVRRQNTKAQRTGSLKDAVPKVLKKVVEEGKKIIHDTVDPPKPVTNQPPSIERWLDTTVDPFSEKSAEQSTSAKKEGSEKPQLRRRSSSEVRGKGQDTDKTPTRKRSVSEHRKAVPIATRRQSVHNPTKPSVQKEPAEPVTAKKVSEERAADATTPSRTHLGPRPKAQRKSQSHSPPVESEISTDLSKSTESTEWTTSTESTEEMPEKVAESKEMPKMPAKSPSSATLKRSKATRNNSHSSPTKPAVKKPWKEALKDAFRGESTTRNNIPANYPSQEKRDYEVFYDDEYSDLTESTEQTRPSVARTSPPAEERHPPMERRNREAREHMDEHMTELEAPRRKPPTSGFHQLSTIMSEESFERPLSDVSSSYFSETTVTQTATTQSTITASSRLTDSMISSRLTDIAVESTLTDSTMKSMATESTIRKPSQVRCGKSQRSGLKRRLTNHSDLVSVLSLPEDPSVPPSRTRSIMSARNVNRSSSKREKGGLRGLLREFREDENLYGRELKTLVDGVVPVLVNHVVQGDRDGSDKIFGGSDDESGNRAAMMSKAVVGMGISLEKIRNYHNQVPLMDARALLNWLDLVYPIYNGYLDVWRLGFDDVVVNLEPALGILEEEDSLINAMPRDRNGDIVNNNGERVDVAHLLKRPLHRVKMMTRFVKGCQQHIGPELDGVLSKYITLQDKARQRHKEETARIIDEEACTTDTSRVRDLRTLSALGYTPIDQTRQVNAKDLFELDLQHSNGQRLTCQVELVYRDNARISSDKGDVLIRETGNKRNWLLFEPVARHFLSARRGDKKDQIVVLVRGYHRETEWFELVTLSTEYEDQIVDWLDILGSDPYPPPIDLDPSQRSRIQYTPSSPKMIDVPLGERSVLCGDAPKKSSPAPRPSAPSPTSTPSKPTPSRYHRRQQSAPSTPTASSPKASNAYSPNRTPTQDSYNNKRQKGPSSPTRPRSRDSESTTTDSDTTISQPLTEMRPDPATKYQDLDASTVTIEEEEDKPPPPPAHKTFKKPPKLAPPPEKSARLRRHGSSPLKHEYTPSDISSSEGEWEEGEEVISDSSTSSDEGDLQSESETESSADELDSEDASIITPAISIRKPQAIPEPARSHITNSHLASELGTELSQTSLLPENSASQVGIPQYPEEEQPEYLSKTVATISYWSVSKAKWRDMADEPCHIVVTPGLLEAFPLSTSTPSSRRNSGGTDDDNRPLVALELTPVVMIRQSTVIDLEIRSPACAHSRLKLDASIFRFRVPNRTDSSTFYSDVHNSRLNNAKFKAIEQEARFRQFGQPAHHDRANSNGDDASRSSRTGRNWFGRKNSYRAARAPPSTIHSASQSTSMSSGVSAASFFQRIMGRGNNSFNIAKSSVDNGSGGSGDGSMYGSSSSGDGGPRGPSFSYAGSTRGRDGVAYMGTENLKIRCHIQVSSTKWEDRGNCRLQITRPPPGVKQELRAWQGLEKRVIVTAVGRKKSGFLGGDKDGASSRPGTSAGDDDGSSGYSGGRGDVAQRVVLDVVLGSGSFSKLGSRGIVLNVWEEGRGIGSDVGRPPETGMPGGKVTKWCFQCVSATEANWIFGLVSQEVEMAM